MDFLFSYLEPLRCVCLLVVVGVVGTCAGGFVSCLASKRVSGVPVLRGGGHRVCCDHGLAAKDPMATVSWMAFGGRCRHRDGAIGLRYVISELLLCVVFVAFVVAYGLSLQALAYCALSCVLLAIALVDLETFTIPNGYVLAGVMVWALTVWGITPPPADASGCVCGIGSSLAGAFGDTWTAVAADGIVAAIVFGGGMLLFSVAFDLVTGKRSLGGGDIKLLFMVGLFLGLQQSFLNLMLSCFLGLAFFAVFGSRGKSRNGNANGRHGSEGALTEALTEAQMGTMANKEHGLVPEKAFPFGPAISLSTIMVLLLGRGIISAYLALL